MSVIEDIREDRTYIITYGYIVLCAVTVLVGVLSIALGEVLEGTFMIAIALVGIEIWTHWFSMWWARVRRAI